VTAPSPADDDGKKGVAYHEASVGTLSFFDAEGECWRSPETAEFRTARAPGELFVAPGPSRSSPASWWHQAVS
jgi:hypothetical protein